MYDANPGMLCSLGVCTYCTIDELMRIYHIIAEFERQSIMSELRSCGFGPEEHQQLSWNYRC
jgi:hypothetical protein